MAVKEEECAGIHIKRMHSITLDLTEEQKKAIRDFWEATGGIGAAEIKVDVVQDRISPASIQVGTAK